MDAEVLPNIREWDAKGEAHPEVFRKMAALGFLGAPIPEVYGGAGMDYISFALLCEELELGDTAFRVVQSVHVALNSLTLLQWGSEEQRRRRLVPQARGPRRPLPALRVGGPRQAAQGSGPISLDNVRVPAENRLGEEGEGCLIAMSAIDHGANGYSNEFPVERYLRTSKAAVIYEGTSQLHALIQADFALGYREDKALRCEPWPAQGCERGNASLAAGLRGQGSAGQVSFPGQAAAAPAGRQYRHAR